MTGRLSGIKKAMNSVNPKMARIFMPFILKHPRYIRHSAGMLKQFNKSEETRAMHLADNLMIPPIMILSITNQCNLRCKGCFAAALGNMINEAPTDPEKRVLNTEEWDDVISQSVDLGVYTFLIAGGEPFMFKGLLDLCNQYKENLFLIFTNGTLLTEAHYKKLKKMTNLGIVVSVEGGEEITDSRRGKGTFKRAIETVKRLGSNGIFSGISVTITRENFRYWMEDSGIDEFINEGIHLSFLTEYIPVDYDGFSVPEKGKKESLVLTPGERLLFRKKVLEFKEKKQMLIIHSPGDEELFGGCVSAGKGFAHINAKGDITPCPVSDIATHNIKTASLKEGFESPLFKKIRENEEVLETGDGPCALFEHQKEVEALRKRVGGYRTNQ